jgi:hypothetical protein
LAYVSISRGGILLARLLLSGVVAECGRDRQSDCGDDREEPYASSCGKTSRAEHKQGASVANFRLVQERIAFDNHKCNSRRPEAEAHEPAAHATRR